jgi:hypothetical protein
MAETILKIEGIHPTIDGDYPISVSEFTNRDFNDIKRIAKVRVQELQEAFEQRDTDLFVAFAVIALKHAGKPVIEDLLWDAPIGRITLIAGDEEEVDDLPPASAPPSAAPSGHGGDVRLSGTNGSSGDSSSNGSDRQENDPSPTGVPGSVIGVTSQSERLAT